MSGRAAVRGAATVLGWLVLVAAVDLAAGAVVGHLVDGGGRADVLGEVEEDEVLTAEERVQVQVRSDTPAMRDLPWAEDYWEEYFRVRFAYEPFFGSRAAEAPGPLITVDDGVRRSYQPTGADLPEVWFFGGSTMWGEGQRDEHTIPSEVARLAEVAGTPVRVRNLGSPGYTAWASMLRFEEELAQRPPPAVAVFYDGTNDLNYQQLARDEQRRLGLPEVADPYYDASTGGTEVVPAETPVAVRRPPAWWERWERSSLLGRVLLGSAEAGEQRGEPAALDTEEQALQDRLVEVSARAAALVLGLAAADEVPVVQAWQPIRPRPAPLYAGVAPRLDGYLDLTAALDGVDPGSVYLDGAHTNERGARLVAEALWPSIQAVLAS